jgi:hypothetical protein
MYIPEIGFLVKHCELNQFISEMLAWLRHPRGGLGAPSGSCDGCYLFGFLRRFDGLSKGLELRCQHWLFFG